MKWRAINGLVVLRLLILLVSDSFDSPGGLFQLSWWWTLLIILLKRLNTTDYTKGAIADNCGGFVDISRCSLLRDMQWRAIRTAGGSLWTLLILSKNQKSPQRTTSDS
ncbi:hypothetical protein C2G38_2237614 [Gigaspora rosea]|uniref:Secreted protein n=1 Tax=Gigaspora rosea TaxID=44941 RepID=A0A397TQV3_9GLOM|nr:hypothetical protein C2G38_2237614 [Gigaspora rosea]